MATLEERALICSDANLRLFNLRDKAMYYQSRKDVDTLLNFTVEGLPLAYYLPRLSVKPKTKLCNNI